MRSHDVVSLLFLISATCRLDARPQAVVQMQDREDTVGDMKGELTKNISSCEGFALKKLGQHEYASGDIDRLERLDSSCSERLEKHERGKPERPTKIDPSVFPRYGQVRADLQRAWTKHRVLQLNQPPRVTQRINPTLVIADPFYAQAAQFSFCDDGVCQYNGPIFVHLQRPSVVPYLMPDIKLQYVGLKTYTTVLGASETIPEFRQVEAKQFPEVFDAQLRFDQFKPTPEEARALVAATEKNYGEKLTAWAADGIQIESTYLAGRIQLVERILKPWVGIHHYSVGDFPSDEVPESAEKMLPGLVDNYDKTTARLLGVLKAAQERVGRSPQATGGTAKIYEYTKGWLRLSRPPCGSSNPLILGVGMWRVTDPSTYPWDVLECWATPRFELPRMPEGQSQPVEPPWWSDYVTSQQSLLHPSYDRP